jgi:hypothetical protein
MAITKAIAQPTGAGVEGPMPPRTSCSVSSTNERTLSAVVDLAARGRAGLELVDVAARPLGVLEPVCARRDLAR